MFTRHTILSLQALSPGALVALPVHGYFRNYHFVRNVMEVKRYLLHCLRHMNPSHFPPPDFILVDADRDNTDIKTELERWMEAHPRLRRVKVIFPAKLSWIRRRWPQWIQRAGKSAEVG